MKRGSTWEWDLPLDFYWWLSTKHSTSSHKSNTTTSRIVYGRVLPCNLLPSSNKTLNILHNTSHAFEVKQDMSLSLLVLYAPGLALLKKRRVRVREASRGCPPSSTTMTSFSCGKPPVTTCLHVMTMHGSLIKWVWFKNQRKLTQYKGYYSARYF
jgi:hypothetical protein